jgi:predicted MPP superfamily phosphohydrolase
VVREGDTVVFLGDYIDRGPNSKECVDAILSLQQDVAAEVVCLCGNHEDWFMRTLRDHSRAKRSFQASSAARRVLTTGGASNRGHTLAGLP